MDYLLWASRRVSAQEQAEETVGASTATVTSSTSTSPGPSVVTASTPASLPHPSSVPTGGAAGHHAPGRGGGALASSGGSAPSTSSGSAADNDVHARRGEHVRGQATPHSPRQSGKVERPRTLSPANSPHLPGQRGTPSPPAHQQDPSSSWPRALPADTALLLPNRAGPGPTHANAHPVTGTSPALAGAGQPGLPVQAVDLSSDGESAQKLALLWSYVQGLAAEHHLRQSLGMMTGVPPPPPPPPLPSLPPLPLAAEAGLAAPCPVHASAVPPPPTSSSHSPAVPNVLAHHPDAHAVHQWFTALHAQQSHYPGAPPPPPVPPGGYIPAVAPSFPPPLAGHAAQQDHAPCPVHFYGDQAPPHYPPLAAPAPLALSAPAHYPAPPHSYWPPPIPPPHHPSSSSSSLLPSAASAYPPSQGSSIYPPPPPHGIHAPSQLGWSSYPPYLSGGGGGGGHFPPVPSGPPASLTGPASMTLPLFHPTAKQTLAPHSQNPTMSLSSITRTLYSKLSASATSTFSPLVSAPLPSLAALPPPPSSADPVLPSMPLLTRALGPATSSSFAPVSTLPMQSHLPRPGSHDPAHAVLPAQSSGEAPSSSAPNAESNQPTKRPRLLSNPIPIRTRSHVADTAPPLMHVPSHSKDEVVEDGLPSHQPSPAARPSLCMTKAKRGLSSESNSTRPEEGASDSALEQMDEEASTSTERRSSSTVANTGSASASLDASAKSTTINATTTVPTASTSSISTFSINSATAAFSAASVPSSAAAAEVPESGRTERHGKVSPRWSRSHTVREPVREEFDTKEQFDKAWQHWRKLRNANNDSVKRSRENKKRLAMQEARRKLYMAKAGAGSSLGSGAKGGVGSSGSGSTPASQSSHAQLAGSGSETQTVAHASGASAGCNCHVYIEYLESTLALLVKSLRYPESLNSAERAECERIAAEGLLPGDGDFEGEEDEEEE